MYEPRVPPEWKQLLEVCGRFVTNEIDPQALEADQGSKTRFVSRTLQKLSEIGVLGILTPEKFGGSGFGPLAASLMLNVLSGGCAGVATALAYHLAAQAALLEGGSDYQKQLWFKTTAGADGAESALSTCIFPPGNFFSRKDREWLALEGSGENVTLDGKAGLVVGASLASFLTVFVRTRGDLLEGPVTGLMIPADREGIDIGERETFGGLKALPIHPVVFSKVKVAPEDIIGKAQTADGLLMTTRSLLHAFLGAIAMGVGRSAYRKAFAYSCERYQYGKIIAHHQEIQRMLGNMLTLLHAGTALYIQAISGESLEGICSGARGEFAKVFCTNSALEIALDAVQIHGGYGYMQDYGVEKLMRDVKMLQLLECTNPVLQIEAARAEVEKVVRKEST